MPRHTWLTLAHMAHLWVSSLIQHKPVDVLIRCLSTRKKPPVMICEGPILPHHNICVMMRPSSQVPLLGKDKVKKGILKKSRAFWVYCITSHWMSVSCVKKGQLGEFKKTVILFQNAEQMALVHLRLAEEIGLQT